MTAPALIFWAVFALGLLSSRPILIFAFFAATPFGMLSLAPPSALGGVSIQPQTVAGILLFVWLCRRRGAARQMLEGAVSLRGFALLTLFVVYAVASAFLLSRIFAGQVDVVPMRGDVSGASPLAPSSANITQSLYLTASFLATGTFFVLLGDERMRRHVLNGLLLAGALLIASGLADMAFTDGPVLAPFRNASYALLADAEVLNLRRVIGLMPEASSFGVTCATVFGALYFLRPAFKGQRIAQFLSVPILCGLLIMTVLSTSSTAYVGLAITLALAAFFWLYRIVRGAGRAPKSELVADITVLYLAGLAGVLLYALHREAFDPVFAMIDETVLKKAGSDSFAQRSMWSAVAFDAFIKTRGIGVGVGSVRAANWPISVLASTGVFGAALLAGFILQSFLRRPAEPTDRDLLSGAKFGMIAFLAMATVSGAAPDFGAMGALYFALITELGFQRRIVEKAPSPEKSLRRPRIAPRSVFWRP